MPAYVVAAVLFAAFLHALWNIIVKGGDNKLYETGLNALGGGLGALCVLPFLSPLPIAAWTYLAVSAFCHFFYYICVAEAYKKTDLSFSYTVMRGCAPLLTSLVMLFLGTDMSLAAWGGVGLLCCGILCLAGGRGSRTGGRALFPALRTSVVIMGYTIFDGLGARQAGDAVSYACWIFICNIVPLNAFILWHYGMHYLRYARGRARMVGGVIILRLA